MFTPELSIIVYARGSAQVIARTLGSIRGQLFQEWECIVVEDGSSDATAAVVQKTVDTDSRFLLVRQSYGGVAKAYNRGFMESTPAAAYVAFIDAGDVWVASAMGDLRKCLEENLSVVGAHGLARPVDEAGKPVAVGGEWQLHSRRLGYRDGGIREWPSCEPSSFETLVWADDSAPSGVLLVRRTAYEAVGLYDASLSECAQWDMMLRLSRVGPIGFLESVVLYELQGDADKVFDARKKANDARRVQRKTFYSAENSQQQAAVLRDGWRAWQRFKIKEKSRTAVTGSMIGVPARVVKLGVELLWHVVDYVAGRPALLGF